MDHFDIQVRRSRASPSLQRQFQHNTTYRIVLDSTSHSIKPLSQPLPSPTTPFSSKMLLTLTAELNGSASPPPSPTRTNPPSITGLIPTDTPDAPFHYHLRLRCTSCREDHPNAVPISRFDAVDVPGSKGTANLVLRCRNCGKDGNLSITRGPRASPLPFA